MVRVKNYETTSIDYICQVTYAYNTVDSFFRNAVVGVRAFVRVDSIVNY